MSVTIYHNPRCSKSRQTLQLLRDNGVEPEIVEYLKTPPSTAEIKNLLGLLGLAPRDLMRKKEAPYGERGLADESLSDADLIAAMHDEPVLIERPIVVKGKKAVLGRPPENVLDLL
jgi:arsenate reductase